MMPCEKKIEERNGHAKYVEKIVELSTFKKKNPVEKYALIQEI